ncbi:MAG: hypothetical protein AAF481_15250 [Acidobacteriota bacterium]
MSGLIALLYVHAWRRRESLRLNALERFDPRTDIRVWAILAGYGVLSALVAPPTTPGVPGWVFMLLPVVIPIHRVWTDRRRKVVATLEPA